MSASQQVGGKTAILFISSAEQPGADTFIHALIMRTIDRASFDVHVAYSPAYNMLSAIPELRLRPSNFGPSLSGCTPFRKAIRSLGAAATLASFVGLARYVRRHRIEVLHSTDRPRDAVACAVLGKLTGMRRSFCGYLLKSSTPAFRAS